MRIVRTNLLIVIITKPNPMHGQILKHHSLETCIKLKVCYSAAQASQRVVRLEQLNHTGNWKLALCFLLLFHIVKEGNAKLDVKR